MSTTKDTKKKEPPPIEVEIVPEDQDLEMWKMTEAKILERDGKPYQPSPVKKSIFAPKVSQLIQAEEASLGRVKAKIDILKAQEKLLVKKIKLLKQAEEIQ